MKIFPTKTVIYLIAQCLLFCASTQLLSTTYDTSGSNNTYYVAGTNTFLFGEYAKGFVKFTNGFNLTAGVTTEVAITEAVTGTINLNNGTLKITQDLHLAEGTVINGPGEIWCVGDASIILEGNATIGGGDIKPVDHDVSGGGVLSINGNGYSLLLDASLGGAINLDQTYGTICTLNNLMLINVSSTTLKPSASPFQMSELNLDNSTLYMSGDASIVSTLIRTNRTVNFIANKGSLIFLQNCVTYIQQASKLYISPDTTLKVSFPQPIPPVILTLFRDTPIVFTDSSSELFLDSCTLFFAFPNIISFTFNHAYFTNGTMTINGLVKIDKEISGNPAPHFHYFDLVIGSTASNPVSADNFKLVFLPDARMRINNNEINMKICRDV